LLELNDYQVLTAANGREGLEALSKLQSPPDLIISDIMMPEMNGYDFYTTVSENPEWNAIPFIFLSAKSDVEDIRFAKKLGVDDYVTKPFEEKDLLAIIEGKLRRSKNNKELRQRAEECLLKANSSELQAEEVKNFESNFQKSNLTCFLFLNCNKSPGPELINFYPKDREIPFSVEEIVLQLFTIFQSLYGNTDEIQAQGVLLNVTNISQMAYLYFDQKINSATTGGVQLFMLAIISPNIHYLASLRIQEVLDNVTKKIKSNVPFDIQDYGTQLETILGTEEKKLKELWVFHKVGAELASYAPETTLDPNLLGNFLSALQSFTLEMSQHDLKLFQISSEQYLIYREPNYLFFIVGKTSKLFPEAILIQTLKKISQDFWSKFSNKLKYFSGDVRIFQSFRTILKEYIG
jgi:CheY-like chemotaxis protein